MNQPRDELLERYADAVAQDPRRPSERVRNAACAHAQLLHDQTAAMLPAKNGAAARPAANQPQWTLSLVASLAVVGLAGLMYLQIDRSTQQDREIAMGAAAPSPTNPATAVATHQEKSANPVVPPRRSRRKRAPARQQSNSLTPAPGWTPSEKSEPNLRGAWPNRIGPPR